MIPLALRQIAILLGLALLPAFISGAIQLQPTPPPGGAPVRPAELLTEKRALVWVDSRTQAEFEAGHAAHAILLNLEGWDALIPPFLDAWHPDKLVVVYDDGGPTDTASAVGRRLETDLQMKNIRYLRGGWQRWQAK